MISTDVIYSLLYDFRFKFFISQINISENKHTENDEIDIVSQLDS